MVLAVRPQVKSALAQDGWAALPGLQTDPTSLDGRNLPGWGSLRLALPAVGAADAAYLAAEAVATTSAPPNTPPTAGLGAVSALLSRSAEAAGQHRRAGVECVGGSRQPAAGPVHAVLLTEQQLFARATGLADASNIVAGGCPAALPPLPTTPPCCCPARG